MEDRKRRRLQSLIFDESNVELSAQLNEEAENLCRFLGHEAINVETMAYPEDVYPKTPFSLGRKGGTTL
jgi:hypothetical protein